MQKVVFPDSNQQLFETLNGQFARIITNDKSIKLASSDYITKEMLDECMPDKDHILIHLVGVGDYEKYGFNKNADAFPKKANEKYYKTFETDASLYREHNNSQPIGEVKKAVYNDKMGRIEIAVWANKKKAAVECEKALEGLPLSFSMGCFPKGVKITMYDLSEKNIENISVGDKVITHLGNIKEVYRVLPHSYTGDIYTLGVAGDGGYTHVTKEHPYLIRRYCEDGTFIEDWIEVKDLKLGDYVLSPFVIYADNNFDGNAGKSDIFVDGDKVFKKIKYISREVYKDILVYNFSVRDDESYIANGAAVHNCTVPHDRDSISGKLSKTAADYEPWMRLKPCQYIDTWNGKIINKYAFVYNDEPRFFDISIVENPAERIARYLEYRMSKAASSSDLNQKVLTGAELALDVPDWHNKSLKIASYASLLNKLSKVENDLILALQDHSSESIEHYNIKCASAYSVNKNFELDISDIKELKKLRPETILGELSKRASILPFMSFVDLFMGGVTDAKLPVLKIASQKFLPIIYTLLDKDNKNGTLEYADLIESECPVFESAGNFGCSCDLNNTDSAQKIMDKIEDNISLSPDKITDRIRINISLEAPKDLLRGLPWDMIAKSISELLSKSASSSSNKYLVDSFVNNAAKKYAGIYAMYTLSALQDAENKGSLKIDNSSMLHLISQNIKYLK